MTITFDPIAGTAVVDPPTCRLLSLPPRQLIAASQNAVVIRPENDPYIGPDDGPLRKVLDATVPPLHAAMLTTAYWGEKSASKITVGFLDNPTPTLKSMILQCANMWAKRANVGFVESAVDSMIRISREPGHGYASYLGVGCLMIPRDQPTMWFDSFTELTPWSEFLRVVCHEFGHGLGLIHEHMRKEIVVLIDPALAIPYYWLNQMWDKQQVENQVLTAYPESSLFAETPPDPNSIMCYPIPGSITYNRQPILGGAEIDENDYDLVARLYPLATTTPTPTPTPTPTATPDRIRYLLKTARPTINRALRLNHEVSAAEQYTYTLLQIPGGLETLIAYGNLHEPGKPGP